MPIFTLEAFEAEQGDCFLIHFGANSYPRFLLVDGGPGSGIYKKRLKPRLTVLGKRVGTFELPVAVCSHIDADHIGGVLALVEELAIGAPTAKPRCLWHNRPLDLVGESNANRFAAALAAIEESEQYATEDSRYFSARNWQVDAAMMHIVASVEEGDRLYSAAREAGVELNCGFSGLVMAPTPEEGFATYTVDGLMLTVIGPDAEQIDALRKKWEKETREQSTEDLYAASKRITSIVAADDDTSVTNLSSIVFLAEYDGHSILMTGDARGGYIRDGLERAGRARDGQVRVDLLKLQHHGSARNVDKQFFEAVMANHYVISANGMYGNPDEATIDALVAARGEEGYRLWLTNGDTGTPLAPVVARLRAKYRRLALEVRPARCDSQLINLAEPVNY